jgi:chemotaxis protein CheX
MDSKQIEQAYHTQIGEFVSTLFTTMLSTEIAPAEIKAFTGSTITALVAFGGKWTGVFAMECDQPSALDFARRFLQCDDLEDPNEVRDALGELANVVAGNLKQILPQGTTLAAPSIVEGTNYTIRICGEHIVGSTGFSTKDSSLIVRLIQDSKTSEASS